MMALTSSSLIVQFCQLWQSPVVCVVTMSPHTLPLCDSSSGQSWEQHRRSCLMASKSARMRWSLNSLTTPSTADFLWSLAPKFFFLNWLGLGMAWPRHNFSCRVWILMALASQHVTAMFSTPPHLLHFGVVNTLGCIPSKLSAHVDTLVNTLGCIPRDEDFMGMCCTEITCHWD